MSRHGDLTIPWADRLGDEDDGYTFRIGIAEVRRLQEKFDAGPEELFERLRGVTSILGTFHRWKLDEAMEIIRQGLIGGGSVKLENGEPDLKKINRLVRDEVENQPWGKGKILAARIMAAALAGPEDEELPKSKAGTEPPTHPFPAEKSASEPSTDGPLSSDTAPPRSIN